MSLSTLGSGLLRRPSIIPSSSQPLPCWLRGFRLFLVSHARLPGLSARNLRVQTKRKPGCGAGTQRSLA